MTHPRRWCRLSRKNRAATPKQPLKHPQRIDKWQGAFRYRTPRGKTTLVADVEAYVNKINEGHAEDAVGALRAAGCDLKGVVLYRLFLRGKFEQDELDWAVTKLMADGAKFAIVQVRVSGSENQQDGASLPQQERDGILRALHDGATRVLLICEVYSATVDHERVIFQRLMALVSEARVNTWYVAAVDRITRSPPDAAGWVYSMERSKTRLTCATHDGPLQGTTTILTLLYLMLGALVPEGIKRGNLRGWTKRVESGEWVGKVLPGMTLDAQRRPTWIERAKLAIPRLFALLDPDGEHRILRLDHAMERVNAEFPGWWADETEPPPSIIRILRLVMSDVAVDGSFEFPFKEERREVSFPRLAGLLTKEQCERVQDQLVPRQVRRAAKESAWTALLRDLLTNHHRPMHLIVAESRGTIGYRPDGSVSVACPRCPSGGFAAPPPVKEVNPSYMEVGLHGGGARQTIRVPTFRCQSCDGSFRPLDAAALRRLYGNVRRLSCPECGDYDVSVSSSEATIRRDKRKHSLALATCRGCGHSFGYDPARLDASGTRRHFPPRVPSAKPLERRAEPILERWCNSQDDVEL